MVYFFCNIVLDLNRITGGWKGSAYFSCLSHIHVWKTTLTKQFHSNTHSHEWKANLKGWMGFCSIYLMQYCQSCLPSVATTYDCIGDDDVIKFRFNIYIYIYIWEEVGRMVECACSHKAWWWTCHHVRLYWKKSTCSSALNDTVLKLTSVVNVVTWSKSSNPIRIMVYWPRIRKINLLNPIRIMIC